VRRRVVIGALAQPLQVCPRPSELRDLLVETTDLFVDRSPPFVVVGYARGDHGCRGERHPTDDAAEIRQSDAAQGVLVVDAAPTGAGRLREHPQLLPPPQRGRGQVVQRRDVADRQCALHAVS
jgi:hypothetical protein